MKNLKQIFVKKNGSSVWNEYMPARTLAEFNRDFADWVARYYDGCEQQECKTWEEAQEVLDTVGSSAVDATFKIKEVK